MRRRARNRGATCGARQADGLTRWIGVLSTVCFGLFGAAQAGAQDLSRFEPGPEDRADAPAGPHDALFSAENTLPAIKECLEARAQAGVDRRDCIGLAMDICIRFRVNETTLGSILCSGGETEAWDAIIEERLTQIRWKADDGLEAALETSQTRWLAHREAACGLWGEVFRGGSLARQIGADCHREMAARRALDLIEIDEALVQ